MVFIDRTGLTLAERLVAWWVSFLSAKRGSTVLRNWQSAKTQGNGALHALVCFLLGSFCRCCCLKTVLPKQDKVLIGILNMVSYTFYPFCASIRLGSCIQGHAVLRGLGAKHSNGSVGKFYFAKCQMPKKMTCWFTFLLAHAQPWLRNECLLTLEGTLG